MSSSYDDRNLVVPITPVQQMFASSCGALLTSLFVTPLDVVKIRLQAQQKPITRGCCFTYCNGLMDSLEICACLNGETSTLKPWYNRQPKVHLNGTMDAFMKIARYEGVSSLWSGLPPTLVMAVPATVIYFTTYDQLKYMIGYSEHEKDTLWRVMLAGSLARIGAATAISPLELIRTKMQSQQLSYTQIGQAVKSTIGQTGLLSVMRGLGPTILRDVPFSAIYWFGYESMKSYIIRTQSIEHPSFLQCFGAGAIAGSVAGVITLPFDVVKTHRQIELGEIELRKGNNGKPTSTWSLLRQLYSSNGVQGLFAGLIPRVVKVAPACAIMISTYEYSKRFFRTYNEQKALEVS
ncbi:unnamed protein product [Owenia fusiformis]|uniref:Uncharacterized protein n=1 Tax=Owenia fusiformis TaxID=6347 RepID=A0A8J1UVS8_OWEFU|nr:unnamed protein product [Owenia fusiformis]